VESLARAVTTMIFFCDALPPELERERAKLVERRARLLAQLSGDPDPEIKLEIEEIDRTLKAFDQPHQ
jgi:hypothetical protein